MLYVGFVCDRLRTVALLELCKLREKSLSTGRGIKRGKAPASLVSVSLRSHQTYGLIIP